MTKRDKEKIKRLKKRLKEIDKRDRLLRDWASNAQGNMSDPPEADDWEYAEEIAAYCKEMEKLQDEADDIDEKIEDIKAKYEEGI